MADQKFNINSGFYDSVNNDRLYSADEMNRPYKRIITEGVFATPQGTPSTDLQVVSAGSGRTLIVKKGDAMFADKWITNPSDLSVTVPANTNIVPRRDSVILQIDKTQNGRVGSIVYREGIPSSNPQVPDLSTSELIVEKRLTNIYVAPGATAINQDAIVDLRGSSECPWITSLIKQVDTSTLYAQWQAAYQNYYNTTTQEFNSWQEAEQEAFEAFLESLTSDLTVNTNIVTYESHYTSTVDGETVIPINIAAYNKNKDVLQVYVNRLRATPNVDYTISNDGATITLTKDIYAGQNVNFLVFQSVIIGDNATVLQQLQALSNSLTELTTETTQDTGWINFILESGSSFDNTTTPAVRKYGNMVNLRGAIKNVTTTGSTIATLPSAMRPAMNIQYPVSAFADGTISANCVIEIMTTGQIKLVAKSGTIPATAMLPISTNFIIG